jgi:hypothetical protein
LLIISHRKTGKRKNNDEHKETKPYLEKKIYENFSLTKEEILEIVVPPAGMDKNEWLATHSMFITFTKLNVLNTPFQKALLVNKDYFIAAVSNNTVPHKNSMQNILQSNHFSHFFFKH